MRDLLWVGARLLLPEASTEAPRRPLDPSEPQCGYDSTSSEAAFFDLPADNDKKNSPQSATIQPTRNPSLVEALLQVLPDQHSRLLSPKNVSDVQMSKNVGKQVDTRPCA